MGILLINIIIAIMIFVKGYPDDATKKGETACLGDRQDKRWIGQDKGAVRREEGSHRQDKHNPFYFQINFFPF